MKLCFAFTLLLIGLPGHAQMTRTIRGAILSFGDETPLAGITIAELGAAGEGVVSDADGKFTLVVPAAETVCVVLRGIHYEKCVRYHPSETYKTLVVYEPNIRRLKRENRRIIRHWRQTKAH